MKGLIGKKVGMTQVFNDEGNLVPVTVVDVNTCQVVGKRTPEKDKYSAVTLGFGEIREKSLNKAKLGFFKKSGAQLRRHLKEFRVSPEEAAGFNVGDAVKADLFAKGQLVDVTGVTKGRGFQGVMKRWKFKGSQTATRGTHEYRRHPGAIGQRKTPGRVYPNKKLPGHYGVEQVTTQNLTLVDVDVEKGLLLIKGTVAGHNDGIVIIRPSIKVALREQHKAARTK
ncbi:large subunit ribosomal protein L3 [Archangium gephyra]|uniref:Large ribosomal subunit protein uL3 n=2 Tax=Archangium gephyra TaxID=48 RepID=A0ABX9KBQ2_9BACT|nr:50S ribosomal protein L3 [Archangium gephyra]REG37618.1 large subunit ribosomal protein L3 [Archangium gephyra]